MATNSMSMKSHGRPECLPQVENNPGQLRGLKDSGLAAKEGR